MPFEHHLSIELRNLHESWPNFEIQKPDSLTSQVSSPALGAGHPHRHRRSHGWRRAWWLLAGLAPGNEVGRRRQAHHRRRALACAPCHVAPGLRTHHRRGFGSSRASQKQVDQLRCAGRPGHTLDDPEELCESTPCQALKHCKRSPLPACMYC